MADLPFNSLFGIKVIESEMMPKNKMAFIGKSDTLSKGGLSKTEYPRVREWFEGANQCVGMMDLETGEMSLFKDAIINEVRANAEGVKTFTRMMTEKK
jgi:hypothetical protein